mmetsp:Transcript_8589/g.17287  ORF Transcript_8589/g.17287 Transcript_8589/m.17287 type:complete len:251 (+) Transcript_8589:653-1405(+)
MDGTDTRESFGEAAEAIARINVRRGSVTTHRVHVSLEFLDCSNGRFIHVCLVQFKAHGVRDELLRIRNQSKIRVQFTHRHGCQVATLVRGRVLFLVRVNINKEIAETTLFKETHQRRINRFVGCGRNLDNLSCLVHVRSSNRLEFEIARHLGMKQHFGQVSSRHDELGDKIDIVVTVGSKVGRSFTRLELFKQGSQVQRGPITTVVSVTVNLKHFLALHTQKTRNDAFFQARTHHDGIVLAVGQSFHSLG